MNSIHGPSCDGYSISRRRLLATAATLGAGLTVTSLVGDVMTQAVFGESNDTNDNVIVLLSLRGGADGLSMVVPYGDPDYRTARGGLSLNPETLIQRDSYFGLHPAFAPLSSMWSEGRMAAVHAVGMAAPNRSHFEAMSEMEAADQDTRTGWLNRMISGFAGVDMYRGLMSGSAMLPESLTGPYPALAIEDFTSLALPYPGTPSAALQARSLATMYSADSGVVRSAGADALTLAATVKPVAADEAAGPRNNAKYTNSDFGHALARSAALVRSGKRVKAIAIDYGGWDHHSDLINRMQVQVSELASNLAAFFADLGDDYADKVTLLTLSEFGRRLSGNGAYGLDHGYGNCVLVLGAGVRGGRYYSTWPSLASGRQVDGDLAVTTDYRHILASILRTRFSQLSVSDVFPGLASPGSLDFQLMSSASGS